MRPGYCGGLRFLALGASLLAACTHVVVTYTNATADSPPPPATAGQTAPSGEAAAGGGVSAAALAGASGAFFWRLARLQLEDPSAAAALLSADPRRHSETSDPLDQFRGKVEEQTGLRPVVLFLEKGRDPWEAVRERGLRLPEGPGPPLLAFFSGPTVDTLVLFSSQPETGLAEASRPGRSRILLASLSPGPVPSPPSYAGRGPTTDALPIRLYGVEPREWTPGVHFAHTRCLNRRPGLELATMLFYEDGTSDSETVLLRDDQWQPCPFTSDSDVSAVVVDQLGRQQAGRPVVITATYPLDPFPGYFLADWVTVR